MVYSVIYVVECVKDCFIKRRCLTWCERYGKNLILWVIIAIVDVRFNSFTAQKPRPNMLAYSDFIDQVNSGSVQTVTINGRRLMGHLHSRRCIFHLQPRRLTVW